MKRRILCCLLSIIMVFSSFNLGYPGQAMAEEVPVGVSMVDPDIAYDQSNNNYLTVYTKLVDGTGYLSGQLLNAQGVSTGAELIISNLSSANVQPSVVDAVYAGAPAYLAVWLDDDKIYGQFMNAANGVLIGGRIQISDENAIPSGGLSVAFDSVNERCLVAWEDYRYPADVLESRSHDIYGQLVAGDAALQGGNFAICNNGADGSQGEQYEPAVAFDSINQRYLVVWQDFRSFDTNDIYGQFVSVNGEMMGINSKTNFLISNAPGNQTQPTVAYDSVNQDFLVAFCDSRNGGGNKDIYGQIVSGAAIMGGLRYTTSAVNMAISSNNSQQQDPAASFNPETGRYLVIWEDDRNTPDSIDIYGQMINAGGSLYPVPSDSGNNFTVLSREGFSQTPALVFNSRDKAYLLADSYNSGDGLNVIDYALIPPEVDFQGKVDYLVGAQPYGIAADDFNGDGHKDLVVTNGNESTYSILTDMAGGTFTVQTSAPQIYSPQLIATGDFDGDNHSDLAITASSWGGLAVLKGNGSGNFSPPTGHRTGASANTVIAADVDGDADLDLAVSNYQSDTVSIYLNTNGNFGVDKDADGTNESNWDYNVNDGPCRMVAADFNQDGHPDLAVGCDYADTLNILLNNGTGTFQLEHSLPSGPNPIGIATADFDQDGLLDLAVANFDATFDYSGNVSLFRGSGDGNFSKMGNLSVNDGPVGIVTADFNADGIADLAVANRYRTSVSLLLGNARGGFVRQDFPVGDSPMNLVAEDFNGDSKQDLAVLNHGGNSVSILLSGAASPADNEPPAWSAGTNLQASEVATNSLTLTWTTATDNVGISGYKIYCNGSVIATIASGVTSYSVTGLNPDTAYTFKVEAGDEAGNWSTDGPGTNETTLAEMPIPIADMELVSLSSAGVQGNGASGQPSVGTDGEYVAFSSTADNLAGIDSNCVTDIFVRNRLTGETECVSVSSDGTRSDGQSFFPGISDDGRYVAFQSSGQGLVAGDANSFSDIFLHDRQLSTTTFASIGFDGSQADGRSDNPYISADGRYIVFSSLASNLINGDTNGARDIFLYDRQAQVTTLISKDSAGSQSNADSGLTESGDLDNTNISADNRYIVFTSDEDNLVSGDQNGAGDVFLCDLQTGVTTLVSVDSHGVQGNAASYNPFISANGRYVTFASDAANLVAGDTNNRSDVFRRDLTTGETIRVSMDTDGSQSNGYSFAPNISADGRYITFTSDADNLIDNDTNGVHDVFIHDCQTGETACVSAVSDGSPGNGTSQNSYISSDGNYIAFSSSASNLVDQDVNGCTDLFLVPVTAVLGTIPPTTYTVSIGSLTGGSITANPTSATTGSTITLTITPDSGKQLKAGTLKYNDGSSDHLINGTSFSLPAADVTVTAEFEEITLQPPTSYTVSIGSLTGGSITANPTSATTGSTITLTITPDPGKQLKAGTLKYNDGSSDHLINGTSFVIPAAHVTVTAEFEAVPSNHDGSHDSAGSSHTSSPKPATVNGSVIDRATGDVVSNLTAAVSEDRQGNFTISMNAAQIAMFKQPNGSLNSIMDLSKVTISSAAGSPLRISSNATLQAADLARGTNNSFSITYELGNGQRITIGTMEIKIDRDGNVSVTTTLIDPYGIITDADTGKVLEGVNVTLYYADTERNKAAGKTPDTVVALPGIEGFEPNDNKNAQVSDGNGAYGFMVFPVTDYYLVASKNGYNQYKSLTISVEQEIVRWDFRMNQTTSGVTRLAGLDRIDTALSIAKASYSGKVDEVILATADNYPDALAGSVLAYKVNAPILLVGSSEADQEKVLAYMSSNLDPSGTVYILGGTAVVSGAMESKVRAKWPKIIRIAGTDRYETSVKIADQLNVEAGTPVVLVSGENYPDALSISSVASQMQLPILLVQKDQLSNAVRQKIAEIKPSKLYIIGLQGVISTSLENQAAQIAGLAQGNVIRIGGFDQLETSLAVAQYFNLSGYACIATGCNYPDALAGSFYAANHNAPIILVDSSLSDQVLNYLKTRKLIGVTIFGGERVISKHTEQQLEELIAE